jgi:UDP-N-acetylglucosamine 2-epimerase (non-hydrolysing)
MDEGEAMKLMLVAGARPNFMKVAPILRVLAERYPEAGRMPAVQTEAEAGRMPARHAVEWRLVHTGQHYDYDMSKVFFEELEIPAPDHFLGVGSAGHAEQTARVMMEFEKVCDAERPDRVVVVGDVNSTLACALTAVKRHVPVAHVEAGLRSFDRDMPEEINRIVTDAVADLLLVSEPSGLANLAAEGKTAGVHHVGNVMIDTLRYGLARLDRQPAPPATPAPPYAVVTLHRPTNVDEPGQLADLLSALLEIAADMPVHFPIHPRTRKNLAAFGLERLLEGTDIRLAEPMSYLRFLRLWRGAALVVTDSGGIQEETTVLGVPCFTLRNATERPVTVDEGTNVLVGASAGKLRAAYRAFRRGEVKRGRVPALWDGRAAERIVDLLVQ